MEADGHCLPSYPSVPSKLWLNASLSTVALSLFLPTFLGVSLGDDSGIVSVPWKDVRKTRKRYSPFCDLSPLKNFLNCEGLLVALDSCTSQNKACTDLPVFISTNCLRVV
jgi:hypothetical protein